MKSRYQTTQWLAAAALLAVWSGSANAQVTAPYAPIKKEACITGTVDINFKQTNKQGQLVDVYQPMLRVADYVGIRGKAERQWSSEANKRPDGFAYNIVLRPILTKGANAGKEVDSDLTQIRGNMVITSSNDYKFTGGAEPLQIVGPATPSNPFMGQIIGLKEVSYMQKIASALKGATNVAGLKKLVTTIHGKQVSMNVKKSDPLLFQGVTMAGGPWKSLSPVALNGDFTYAYTNDEDNGFWTTQKGITMAYQTDDGKSVLDTLTGSLQYSADAASVNVNGTNISSTGNYKFNLLVNADKNMSEEKAFNGEQQFSEEEQFLGAAYSGKVPSFTGNIYFVDQKNGDELVSSKGYYKIDCNDVSPVQAMNLTKMILLNLGPLFDN